MKKIGAFLFISLLFACNSLQNTKSGISKQVSKTFPFTDSLYELVGIDTTTDGFLLMEPGHGGSGLIMFFSSHLFETTSGINSATGQYLYKTKANGLHSLQFVNIEIHKKVVSENKQAMTFDTLFFSHLRSVMYVKIEQKLIYCYDKNQRELLRFYRKN